MAKVFVEKFIFQPKRKTAAEWESENPILRDGEFGIVTDGTESEWLKVGNGITAWKSLPYKKGPKGDPFTYSDFTAEQLAALKGEKGDPFTYEDFTAEQLASLKGKDGIDGKDGTNGKDGKDGTDGKDGYTPQKGVDYFTDKDIAGLNIPKVDQSYNPDSENPQSGKAVAEAVATEQKRADNTFANALKSNKSGSAILIDDISPVTHEMRVRVRGKNLFDISKVQSINGITNNGDGTLTLCASQYAFNTSIKLKDFCPGLKVGDIVCISCTTNGLNLITLNSLIWNFNSYKTITEEMLNYTLFFYGKNSSASDYNETHTISNIQIELGTSATDYTPYVPDLTAVKVKKQGKNLFDISSSRGFESTYTGLTNTINGNELTVTATANRSGNLLLGTFPKGTYTINLNVSKKVDLFIQYGESISTGLTRLDSKVFNSSHTFSISETRKLWLACPTFTKDNTYIFTDIQFELGTTATEYEPYITPNDYTPTADGTVEGVSSIYPNTTLNTDTDGVLIDCEYNRDINKAFAELQAALISMGGTI